MIDVGVYAFSKDNMLVLAPPLTSDLTRLSAASERLERLIGRAEKSSPSVLRRS